MKSFILFSLDIGHIKYIIEIVLAGVTQLARVTAFQAVGRGFEPRLPLFLFYIKVQYLFIPSQSMIISEHLSGSNKHQS
jgi:hypothetical protein